MECIAVAMTEMELKEHIKAGDRNLYVLYGAEGYLTEQYARMVADKTVEEGFDAFNLQRFDGQGLSVLTLEEAVESLPLMSQRKCVLVRDYDPSGADADRAQALVSAVPETCVLVFWQMTVQPDKRKAGWKKFLEIAEQKGVVAECKRKDPADTAKMLVAGAKRRGSHLDFADAKYLVEQVGNDLNLLVRELDKLCALAGEGDITRRLIDTASPKNLEAKVFDLSKAILRRRHDQAYDLLYQLKTQREEPVPVLAVLSSAYADLYRAKVAAAGGVPADSLAAEYKSYKGKEWRLRNAARDASRMSVPVLRDCLEILAEADMALKGGGGDPWVLLEQTVARLIARAVEG